MSEALEKLNSNKDKLMSEKAKKPPPLQVGDIVVFRRVKNEREVIDGYRSFSPSAAHIFQVTRVSSEYARLRSLTSGDKITIQRDKLERVSLDNLKSLNIPETYISPFWLDRYVRGENSTDFKDVDEIQYLYPDQQTYIDHLQNCSFDNCKVFGLKKLFCSPDVSKPDPYTPTSVPAIPADNMQPVAPTDTAAGDIESPAPTADSDLSPHSTVTDVPVIPLPADSDKTGQGSEA